MDDQAADPASSAPAAAGLTEVDPIGWTGIGLT
jgi:hypothetical protein